MQLNFYAPWVICWLALGWDGDGVVLFLYLCKKDLTTNDFMVKGAALGRCSMRVSALQEVGGLQMRLKYVHPPQKMQSGYLHLCVRGSTTDTSGHWGTCARNSLREWGEGLDCWLFLELSKWLTWWLISHITDPDPDV